MNSVRALLNRKRAIESELVAIEKELDQVQKYVRQALDGEVVEADADEEDESLGFSCFSSPFPSPTTTIRNNSNNNSTSNNNSCDHDTFTSVPFKSKGGKDMTVTLRRTHDANGTEYVVMPLLEIPRNYTESLEESEQAAARYVTGWLYRLFNDVYHRAFAFDDVQDQKLILGGEWNVTKATMRSWFKTLTVWMTATNWQGSIRSFIDRIEHLPQTESCWCCGVWCGAESKWATCVGSKDLVHILIEIRLRKSSGTVTLFKSEKSAASSARLSKRSRD